MAVARRWHRAKDAQQNLLRYATSMPVATAIKVEALAHDLGSRAAVADLLGVSRSRVTRWLKNEGIDDLNAEKVDLLELAWSSLLRVYEPAAAREWLLGTNPDLGNRRPIDSIRSGKLEDVLRAIRAAQAESYA